MALSSQTTEAIEAAEKAVALLNQPIQDHYVNHLTLGITAQLGLAQVYALRDVAELLGDVLERLDRIEAHAGDVNNSTSDIRDAARELLDTTERGQS